MNPTAQASPSCVRTSASPRAFTWPNGTQGHHGLVLCDTAAYRSRCSTRASCQISDFGGKNHKYSPSTPITIEYHSADHTFTPADFPAAEPAAPAAMPQPPSSQNRASLEPAERARRYLVRVPPTIAGGHGDVRTFRVCCRLVRGFALDDDQALDVLAGWNALCQPPWTERELREKLWRARRYGREPFAGLLCAKRI